MQKDELPALAGNYARGSSEYTAFLDFVRERAVDVQTENGVTTYTLDEQTVRDWGQSSNSFTIDCTRNQLISGLQELGYMPRLQKTKDEFSVREEPYGVLATCFDRWAYYVLTDEIELRLCYDILSEEITYAGASTSPEKLIDASPCFVDVLSLLAKDMDGARGEWLDKVSETADAWIRHPDKSGHLDGFNFQNISAYFALSSDETKAGISIFSADSDPMKDGMPYNWPT